MYDILSGIRGLKRLNTLIKARADISQRPVEKSESPFTLGKVNPDRVTNGIIPTETKLEGNLFVAVNKDKEILSLIQKKLLCEESIRLKQEIKNYSSVLFFRLS